MVTFNLHDEWCYYACKLVALLPIPYMYMEVYYTWYQQQCSNTKRFFIESVCIMSQLGINQ